MKKFTIILLVSLLVLSMLAGCNQNEIPDEPFPTFTDPTEEPTYDTVLWESILTYRAYSDMSAQERIDFKNSFENPDDFYTWHAAAKYAHDKRLEENQIGNGGSIDIGQIAGKQ